MSKPTDEEIIAELIPRGSMMTYHVANCLRDKHRGLETSFVLRRMKAMEKAGKVRRARTSYVRQLCWAVAAPAPKEPTP